MTPVWTVLYACALLGLLAYGLHARALLRAARRRGSGYLAELHRLRDSAVGGATACPEVLVQLPVFDEPRVVQRLLESAAALDWPADRLVIQLLDDSGAEARALGAQAVEAARRRGVDVRHVCRARREGFKAGALAHGLSLSEAPFVAVFDADFLPPPDFLRRALPLFAGAQRVACVQGRWAHLNREQNFLTRAQAAAIDAHFWVQQLARASGMGLATFNGSAGVWRRAAIEDAGGWSSATLTEDLDLSLRAHLRGWSVLFDPELAVPAELPATLGALKAQQRRWARGSTQCARRLLAPIWRSGLSLANKLEATAHLLGYSTSVAMSALTLLLPLGFGHALTLKREPALWPLWAAVWFAALGPVQVVLHGQRMARGAPLALGSVLRTACVGIGLAANNTLAVIRGLFGRVGTFARTPKQGGGAAPLGSTPYTELACATATLAATLHLAAHSRIEVVAYALFCGSGCWVLSGYWWLRERRALVGDHP